MIPNRRPLTEWRPIPGFEGLYEVSRCGLIRSLTVLRHHGGYRPRVIPGRILKPHGRYGGLVLWDLKGEKMEVRTHRVVALAWVPNPEGNPMVLHRDDDPEHNHADNLYWGTGKENGKDRIKNGRLKPKALTSSDVERIRAELAALPTSGRRYGWYAPIARRFKVSTTTIMSIRDRKTWGHV